MIATIRAGDRDHPNGDGKGRSGPSLPVFDAHLTRLQTVEHVRETPADLSSITMPQPSLRGRLIALWIGVRQIPAGVRNRLRTRRRPRLWQELAFVVASYVVYSLIRDAVPNHITPALQHARTILGAERALHIDVEQTVNHFVAAARIHSWHWLAEICNYYYATMHFIAVIGVLIWLYVRRPLHYRAARTVLYAANALAAAVFWLYPLAPPRLMPSERFVDTLAVFHTWGSYDSGGVAKISNQFAAMPSLHIAWSLWVGLTLIGLTRRWWVKALGAAYPLATLFVIIGTANHFILDAVGGVVVLAIGFAVQRALSGRPAYERLIDVTGESGRTVPLVAASASAAPLRDSEPLPNHTERIVRPEIPKH